MILNVALNSNLCRLRNPSRNFFAGVLVFSLVNCPTYFSRHVIVEMEMK